MPTYEYECLENGHRFEVKQSFTDDKLTECIECGDPVRKVFSAAGIVFKGSGYYVTDTRSAAGSSGSSEGSSASDGSKPESSTSGSSTSDSKNSSNSKATTSTAGSSSGGSGGSSSSSSSAD